MKKIVILSLVAAASLGLAACSKSAENVTETNAAENASVGEAIEDINAAATDAMAAGDAALENAANATEAAADNVANAM